MGLGTLFAPRTGNTQAGEEGQSPGLAPTFLPAAGPFQGVEAVSRDQVTICVGSASQLALQPLSSWN